MCALPVLPLLLAFAAASGCAADTADNGSVTFNEVLDDGGDAPRCVWFTDEYGVSYDLSDQGRTAEAPITTLPEGSGTLAFCEGVYFVRLQPTQAWLAISGVDAGVTTLSAGGSGSVIAALTDDTYVSLRNLGLTGGAGTSIDGALVGGAIACDTDNAAIDLERVNVWGNAAASGGGLNTNGCPIILADPLLPDNQATGSGGGVYAAGGFLDLYESTIRENTASASGGGVYAGVEGMYLAQSTLEGNQAASGAGLYLTDDEGGASAVSFEGAEIVANDATGSGGGLQVAPGTGALSVDLSHVDFSVNTSGTTGGGAHIGGGSVVLTAGSFSFNEATGSGGAIHLDAGASGSNVHFVGNGDAGISSGSVRYIVNGGGGYDAALLQCGADGCSGSDADADGVDFLDDCNDEHSAIYPGAPLIFDDAIDNDCSGGDESLHTHNGDLDTTSEMASLCTGAVAGVHYFEVTGDLDIPRTATDADVAGLSCLYRVSQAVDIDATGLTTYAGLANLTAAGSRPTTAGA